MSKILFLEDDLITQSIFKRTMSRLAFAHDYVLAGSVDEARSLLKTTRFDVVVTDHQLTDGTAFDIIDQVGDVPVIFITGTGDEAIATRALKAGVFDYLIKDLDHTYLNRLPISIENALTYRAQVQQLRMLSHAITKIRESVCIIDPDGYIIFVNEGFCWTYGYHKADILGQPYYLLTESDAAWFEQGETYHRHRDQRLIPVFLSRSILRNEQGEEVAIVEIAQDITERKNIEADLRQRAYHDMLTGLPNRTSFMKRLESLIERSLQDQTYLYAVLFMDLDRFQVINDSLGHLFGDQVLIEVARKLKGCIRVNDLIARMGGDEFTVVLDGIKSVEEAVDVAERIQRSLAVPLDIQGYEIFTSTSIGITISSLGYNQPEDVLRDTDTAMYWAKSRGKDQYAVFEMKMNAGAFIRLQLDLDLRRALERQQFELHYQPIVSVQTGRIVGVETLLRWQHPSRGCIPPDQFIPVAEETGLITPIGEWILWTACQQTKLWHEAGYDSLRVGINLSTRQLQDQDLPELIGRILKEVQLDPTLLELELTESIALMQNLEANIKALKKISQMGVHLAIDDFGTGYSSLVYMKKFPIDTLKIDRSFVAGIGYDSGDMAITKAIIAMTHTLGLNIIAEGVETLEQLAHLRQQQCDEIQGYLVSRPQPAHELSKLLEQDREADILTTISAGSH